MSNKRILEFMENLEKCYSVVQQSSKSGISASDIAQKLGKHRATIHSYLNTLEFQGKVKTEHGVWHPKEPTTQEAPKEKPKENTDGFEFYLKHGLISKEQINAYVAIKTVLSLIPENSPDCNAPEYMALKMLVSLYDAKFNELKKLKDALG